ncbi:MULTISPECIES: NEL-type E3 ubiquitin ligase domain-containing protein [Pseudomonas]|uniref:NEL-type E3 ubiquitin ligase domain-containing protein n=1 Tax=Pseudomonas TaxID=286 RepID=UPI00398FC8A6
MSDRKTPAPRPEGVFHADLRGVHYDFIKARVPSWFSQARAPRRQELADHALVLPAWYVKASGTQKQALAASHSRYRAIFNQVDATLATIQDVQAFAEPLLKAAIKERFKLDIDVRNVYLARKFAPGARDDFYGFFSFDRTRTSRLDEEYRGVSLLEVALANFLPEEEHPARCADCEIITGWSRYDGDVIPDFAAVNSQAKPIAPAAFAKLCRSLDLGRLYQQHIKDILQPKDEKKRQALVKQLQEHQRQQLAFSTEIAWQQFAKKPNSYLVGAGISSDAYRMLKHVLAAKAAPTLDGRPVTFAKLQLLGVELVGPLLIGPRRKRAARVERLVVYLPDDPQQPLKEYANLYEFLADLGERLKSLEYRRFFSRFVPVSEQGAFFDKINALCRPSRSVQPAELAMDESTIKGDLWQHRHQAHVDKILADARAVAVPTDDEDAKARAARLEGFKDAVLSVFNLAAFVVPGLGPLMLVVGAAQMCEEVYEGIDAYEQGETREMWAHFSSIALNVAMLGTGATVLPHVQVSGVVEALKPVILADGKQKLWNPDLSRYKANIQLATDAKPDGLGLYRHEGKPVLVLEGKHYQVEQETGTGQYRVQHPDRTEAYRPLLEHNGEGAWTHEGEDPLTWGEATLLRRLGKPAADLSAERLQQARLASGVETEALREALFDQHATPRLLADSLKRFALHRELENSIEQLRSRNPATYAKADATLQLELMKRRGMLSNEPSLRVLGSDGRELWNDPAPASQVRRVVALDAVQQARGELLEQVLYTLQGSDPALKDIPGMAAQTLGERAAQLRLYLAAAAEQLKGSLLEERYKAQNCSADADVQRVLNTYPQLPAPVAKLLLDGMSAEDLQVFRSSRRLPGPSHERLRWSEQEVRVSRAYEGLFLDSMSNIDTQRLALRTLELLPGWARGTRLELREHFAEGQVLDAIGHPEATARRILVQDTDGQFQGEDFYTALWQVLTPAEQQAMNFTSVTQLKSAILRNPLPREPLRTVLLDHPLRRPVIDPTMRLLGGGRGFKQLVNTLRSNEARVRRLYPSFSDADVSVYIQFLGADVRVRLTQLEADYANLDRSLKTWVRATDTPSDASGARFAMDIRRCWRRETGSELSLSAIAPRSLPALTADFSHVEELALGKIVWNADTQAFLKNFMHIRELRISDTGMTELPDIVGDLHQLTHLRLRGNRIRLTDASAEKLAGLDQLQSLDLAGNPLHITPDFTALQRLKFLDLSNTGITQWPRGLLSHADLLRVDLRNNQLSEIPREHLYPQAEHFQSTIQINGVTVIGGNPFSEACMLEVDNYWKRLGEVVPELAQSGIADAFSVESPTILTVQRMYPDKTIKAARELIWSLGDGAEAELARRATEFDRLTEQLNAWAFSGGGASERYIRSDQLRSNATTRDDRYIAKSRILQCWRREAPMKLAHDGTPIGLELDLGNLRLPSLPDLDADFSHVGSLKLSGMALSASPEGFLSRYRSVRWLDLSNNQLRELPPALGEMHGLTRLFLQKNQIQLTPQTAEVLAGRSSLRALWLDNNPLGIAPDFSRIPDMRSLSLKNVNIDTWPPGLGEQPLLDMVDLSGNQITTLPDFLVAPLPEQRAQSVRLSRVANMSNNPLSEATLAQVRVYSERLEQNALSEPGSPNLLVVSALRIAHRELLNTAPGLVFERWSLGFSEAQLATRRAQWLALRERPGSAGFFRVLSDLQVVSEQHTDLQGRVWEVIDCITQNSSESERLREQMFEWAGRPACCDRAALSFSNLEVMAMVYKARAAATDATQGAALRKLSRGLFRLDEVEKIALNDIAERTAAINATPHLSDAEKARRISRLEEVEIRLAYRFGLKGADQLDLPGQPEQVRFTHMGSVTQAMLDSARTRVLALDNSPQEFEALLSRDFWLDYVTHKYRTQFDALSKPYQERLAVLYEQSATGLLTGDEYAAQAKDLQAQLAIEEANLIEALTREELAAS